MDFIRLFPSSSSTLSTNEDHSQQQQQCSSQHHLLFCAYRNLGLLCHSNGEPNKLHLVIVASASPSSKNTSTTSNLQLEKTSVLFKRITSIVFSPKLPENAQFTNLLVNASGSRAALVGGRMIFVVELDTDFWHRPPFDGTDCVDHLRPEYYAKCDLLHVGLFVRKFPPSVLCVRWFQPASDFLEFFGSIKTPSLSRLNSLFAVLFSDNVIRLYDVSTAVDSPLAQIDFNALLPDRTPEESEASGDEFGRAHSTLGFITQLVSFDFGPPQSVDGNGTALGSLLALDSNGQLYASLFPFEGIGLCPSPKGPLTLFGFPLSSQHRLLCSALELIHISHSFGTQHFSLWAMASEDGLLTHFVLPKLPSSFNTLTLADHANVVPPSFELFVVECIDIGATFSRHLRDPKTSSLIQKVVHRLQKTEFDNNCAAYLVVGQRDVLRVGVTALADHLWHQCSVKSTDGTKLVGEVSNSSNVHQLLMFADSGEAPSIGSVACVPAPAGTDIDGSDEGEQRVKQQMLVAAQCTIDTKTGTKNAFLATLVSCVSSSVSQCVPPSTRSFQNQLGQKAANFDAITTNKKSLLADDVLALLAQRQAVSAVQHQLPQTLPAAVHFTTVASAGGVNEIEDDLEQLKQRASQLSFVQQSIDKVLLQGQLPARSVAIDYALKRSNELLLAFQAVERFRQSATQRLTFIFRQLNELKTKIRQKQQCFRVAEHRVIRVAQSVHSLMVPASDAEHETVQKMKEMQHKLSRCADETAKIGQRIRAHCYALCGGGDECGHSLSSPLLSQHHRHPKQQQQQQKQQLSFIPAPCALHSSHGPSTNAIIPAQLFMLSKNGRECAKLHDMVTSLSDQLNGTKKTP